MQEEMRRSMEDLEAVGRRLQRLAGPDPAGGEPPGPAEDDVDDPAAVSAREVLGCIVHDHLQPGIESLRQLLAPPDAAAAPTPADPADPTAPAWAQAQLEESRREDETCERLFLELQELPFEQQARRVRGDSLYRRPGMVHRLLDESWRLQGAEPARALAYARLAAELIEKLSRYGTGGMASALSRSCCLEAEAHRLLDRGAQAESSLVRAAGFVATPRDRGLYCRTLALLRWEQGHLEEAMALLVYGSHLLMRGGWLGEEGVCRSLLGMLHLERREPWLAVDAFGPAELPVDAARPALAVRARLCLGIARAETGDLCRAWTARESARELYPRMTGEEDLVRADWLEGRLAGRLGEMEDAAGRIEPVVGKLLALGHKAEAAVAAVELAGLLAALGRTADIPGAIAAARAACRGKRELREAAEVLDDLGSEEALAGGWSALRARAARFTFTLRRALRLQGLKVEPPPAA